MDWTDIQCRICNFVAEKLEQKKSGVSALAPEVTPALAVAPKVTPAEGHSAGVRGGAVDMQRFHRPIPLTKKWSAFEAVFSTATKCDRKQMTLAELLRFEGEEISGGVGRMQDEDKGGDSESKMFYWEHVNSNQQQVREKQQWAEQQGAKDGASAVNVGTAKCTKPPGARWYMATYAAGEARTHSAQRLVEDGGKFDNVDGVMVFGPGDIDDDFRNAAGVASADNANTLGVERGVGLWLWKPYVIRKALLMLEEVSYKKSCEC
jgi:hypothetical protein